MAAWREEPPGSGRWRKQIWHLGRPIKLTFNGTKAAADLYEAQRRIDLGAVAVPASKQNVYAYERFCADRYKPHAKATLRASTWSVRKFQLENLLLHFGKAKLPKLQEPMIEAYKMKRLSEGVSKLTINNELKVLSASLTYARDTLKVPCARPKIRLFKVSKKRGRIAFYDRDGVARLLETAKTKVPWFYPLVLFLFETGCRKSEAINLTWSRVMFEQRIVRIWNDAADEDGVSYEVKSVEREIPISDFLLLTLKEQKLKVGQSPWVFPSHVSREGAKGTKLYEFPDNTWKRIATLAGLTGGPHRARHTFASHFLQAKPDLFLLGRVLGHTHTRVTELYAHLVPEHLAAARNVVSFAPRGASGEKSHPGPTPAAEQT